MKLIPNFAELLHEIKLPSPEKCFLIETDDEKYIERWIRDGEIACDLETFFEWINVEYKLKKNNLTINENQSAKDIKKRFPLDQWRVIKIFSDHKKNIAITKKP